MFLKSLELYGFKSFADRTLINFEDGITAIVGDNGCGKSNVVDGIKWVLAERRAKNLRAASMEDIIFNGAGDRPALGMAEVTLTLSNENGLLPIDAGEVSIRRRMYRNKENEYFINAQQCTQGDVAKLFMDTGVGKAAYSVMEQGKIDQVLSSKPEERRYLFEEAAGISRSKSDVVEAEGKLDKYRANLVQLESKLAENKRSYETLKAQAEETTRYRALQEERKDCERDIYLLRLKGFITNKTKQEQEKAEAENKRNAVADEIEKMTAMLHENTGKIRSLEERLVVCQKEAATMSMEQDGKKALSKQLREQQGSVREKIGQLESRIKLGGERIDECDEDMDSLSADKHGKQKLLEDAERNIESFTESVRQCSAQMEDNDRQIDGNKKAIADIEKMQEKLSYELAAITDDIVAELDARLKDAGYSSAGNKKAREELDTCLGQMKVFVSGRENIFRDFASLPSHTEKAAVQFASDAVQSFSDLGGMLDGLCTCVENFAKTCPRFIDDFLAPEGIITRKRGIDDSIAGNKARMAELSAQNEELVLANRELDGKISGYKETLGKLRLNKSEMTQQIGFLEQQLSAQRRKRGELEAALKEQQDDLFRERQRGGELEEQLEELDEQIAELQQRGMAVVQEMQSITSQIEEFSSLTEGRESSLRKKMEERERLQKRLEALSVAIAQSETEIRNVRQNYQENFSRDLMEFEERMYSLPSGQDFLRNLQTTLSQTKEKIASLGNPNLMAVEQFKEEKERYEHNLQALEDARKAYEDLQRVKGEIVSEASRKFVETYNQIRRNFHNMFRRLFNGGRADLRLTEPASVLTSGIEIYAQPPGKKLSSISLLSGGEKTMTAVALLFATYQVHPSPFCLLDEIDAALDDANVGSFVRMLREFANVSQYVVITHHSKTAACANSMLGITMQPRGITKVVPTRLDERTLNGQLEYGNEDGDAFIEEDVEPEEGIVIPLRPGREEEQ